MIQEQRNKGLLIPGAEQVLLRGSGKAGVLLLHGFTGTPAEMRYLGRSLHERGYTVSIPRFPGHGTTLYDMITTHVDDWFRSAREAYIELASLCGAVFVAGHSLGGLFTAHLAAEFDPPGVVFMSVPWSLRTPLVYLTPLVGLFKEIWWERDEIKGVNDADERSRHICYYEGKPVRQSWEVYRYMIKTRRRYRDIRCPALLVYSEGDQSIAPDSSDKIYRSLGSVRRERIMYSRSNHTIPVDYDRDECAAAVGAFFESVKTS